MSSEPVLWSREDHTRAKHVLLLAFFNKWVSIHSESFAKRGVRGLVRIYDGFAGPGVYSDGAEGSPLIVLRALLTNENLAGRWARVRYQLQFVEKNAARARRLEAELTRLHAELVGHEVSAMDQVTWTVTCGTYEANVPPTVREPSALFLFLDPFGYSHAPMTLTQDLVQQPKSDTLIFAPFSFVNRFLGRDGQAAPMDRFFGTSEWRAVPDGPGRPQRLLELFENQLRLAGMDWVGSFRLKPDEANAYYIVGGSAHLRGWASIKEGFWAVDPVHGKEFRTVRGAAPTEQLFPTEDLEPDKADTLGLEAELRASLGTDWFSVEDAIDVTARSRWLDSHLKRATLAPAERAKRLEVIRPTGARQFKEGRGIRLRFVPS
ncbi:MAG: three-Cys-motif partner protein TcmP [Patulibacter sp.]|nr:three-Cys-motif partner protein TcmP [Patulibacter sp.]